MNFAGYSTIAPILLWLSFFACSPCSIGEDRPNIVFILADDLGWADVEFHEGNVPTPNLNQLRRSGAELTSHYVAPVCSPTRTGLLTGRYWSRFGVTAPTNTQALPFETVTIASALRDSGYATCITGKWHLGSKPQWGPNHFGFDHSYGSLAGGVTPWSHFYKKGEYSTTWHRNETLVTEQGHVTDLITNEAVQWIAKRDSDEPFFLYVPFTAVHLPLREPAQWLDRVPKEISGEVPCQYAASILHLDDAIGQIVEAIDKTKNSHNTLIVFTSDNGGSTAENNDTKYPDDNCPNGKLPGNNLPLRGKKGDLYEGGIRVPTIIRWSKNIQPGSVIKTPLHIVDWMPTLCQLAGVSVSADQLKWDGIDIAPALTGNGSLPNRALYSAGTGFRSRTIREADWKLIAFSGKNGSEERVELYNIASDPGERDNRADVMPSIVTKMMQMLKAESARDRDAVASGDIGVQ